MTEWIKKLAFRAVKAKKFSVRYRDGSVAYNAHRYDTAKSLAIVFGGTVILHSEK